MQGFELTYKNKTLSIGVTEGVAVIHIFHLNLKTVDSRISATGRDRFIGKNITWLNEKIESGDEFRISYTGIASVSTPIRTSALDKNIPSPPSKLEQYQALKQSLIERGVLKVSI